MYTLYMQTEYIHVDTNNIYSSVYVVCVEHSLTYGLLHLLHTTEYCVSG